MNLPKNLSDRLQKRIENQSLRKLPEENQLIDFSSNDYLGLSSDVNVFQRSHEYLLELGVQENGATGSRLISGNHELYTQVEDFLSEFHKSESALIFNSGYDANIGFFSSVPQKRDVILYDEYVHASIRDGILLSNAKSYKFKHNDVKHLENLLAKYETSEVLYVVTESVFSMDGDSPDLVHMSKVVNAANAYFVVDEAHAIGVFGTNGEGMIQKFELQDKVFARIITFGKAIGCHGAAILGSESLKKYLVNFARSFIYTTGLPPHSLSTILMSYQELIHSHRQSDLEENIRFFRKEISRLQLNDSFILSNSSIHCCVISGNKKVKSIAKNLQDQSFEVKPILSPTVPEGQERIRFCLHSYNSKEEITNVLETLRTFVMS